MRQSLANLLSHLDHLKAHLQPAETVRRAEIHLEIGRTNHGAAGALAHHEEAWTPPVAEAVRPAYDHTAMMEYYKDVILQCSNTIIL